MVTRLDKIGCRGLRDRPMQRQGSFAKAEYAGKKKQMARDKFLAEVERIVLWVRRAVRLQPLYWKGRAQPSSGDLGTDVADSPFAAVICTGRPDDGGSTVR